MSHRQVAQSYLAAFNHYTFCFFRFSCSATYLNFIQFILDQNNTMPSLDRNLPIKCTKCEKKVVQQQMARHKKNHVIVGLYHVPNVLIFIQRRRKT